MDGSGIGSGGMRGIGWGWILAYGVLSIIIGGLALLWPFSATLAATLVTGMLFIAAGIAAFAAAIGGRGHETRGYDMVFGCVTLVLGCVLLFRPLLGAFSLTMAVATWLGVRGVAEIYWGFRVRRHRWLLLAMGATNILLDLFVLVTLPMSAVTIPGIVLGISFLFGGASAIGIALASRATA